MECKIHWLERVLLWRMCAYLSDVNTQNTRNVCQQLCDRARGVGGGWLFEQKYEALQRLLVVD